MASKKSSEYVRVEQPLFLRRKLLETAIESTEVLRFFESYKTIREEKVSKIKKLRTLMRRIKREISNLDKEMPESKIGEQQEKPEKVKSLPKKTKKVNSLDEELDKIKQKLSDLSI